jgi:multiple sugar transport system permease protein
VEHDVIGIRRSRTEQEDTPAGLFSYTDWDRGVVRWTVGPTQGLLLVLLFVIGLGPILWLAKGAITPTIDTLRNPLAFFPHGVAWSNLSEAWSSVNVGRYFWNTVVLAFGSWLCQIVVATTGAYALSVLRPWWGKYVYALVVGTLFVPIVVLIVPLYIEIVRPPLIHHSFAESYWAIWLPAGASAFNVVLMKRFFDNLPRELFEAARIDGAGPVRLFVAIVLPLSKPILGVVSIFAILAEWRNFLWPFLVLSNSPDRQPLSVRLPAIQAQTQLGVLLASMLIAALVPILGFLVFQRTFLRGQGFGGALKG